MNPIVVEKNGETTYTNYRGVKKQGIIFLALGTVFACVEIFLFAGPVPLDAEYAWFKGNVCMLVWILGIADVAIWTGICLLRRGKSFYVTVGPQNLQSHFGGKTDYTDLRDIDEVLVRHGNGGVKFYRDGKLVLEIPDWFFGSQAEAFVYLLRTRIGV